MRIRKTIVGITAVAVLAVPAAANANVGVEGGVGHVDKGDVQTALKWNNADFDKGVDGLKFAGTYTRTTDNYWGCTDGSTQHRYRVTKMAAPIKAEAIKSSNGKQITGWNMTGVGGPTPYPVISDTGVPADVLSCPTGSSLDFGKPLSINQIGTRASTYTTTDLTVNGVDLPNTPVEVPSV
jgi:hypothetical protein